MTDLAEARGICRDLAKHYENFPVGRWGIPRERKPHIHAIYAFARIADDYADEPEWVGRRAEKLKEWEDKLDNCLDRADEPVFIALADTIRRLNLPLAPFKDLLNAFNQDAVKQRYESWTEVLDYCRRSANPIGRLVLMVSGQYDEKLAGMSDALCTALQLTNFWQDLSVDLKRGRCYLPREDAARLGVDLEALVRGETQTAFEELLELETDRTEELYEESRLLPASLKGRLRFEIAATWLGGRGILEQTTRLGEEALNVRPSLSAIDKILVLIRSVDTVWRG